MTLRTEILDPTRRLLYGMLRGVQNRLKTSVSSSDTTIAMDFDARAVVAGGLIAIEDELMYCWQNPVQNAVEVQRGWFGTTAASHTAGDIVEVNPRWPQCEVRAAIGEEISSWHPRLYAVVTQEYTVGTGDRAFNLNTVPSDFLHLLRIVREPRSGSDSWVNIRGRFERNMNTSDFASGTALMLDDPVETGIRVRVTYARPFATTNLTDSASPTNDLLLAASQIEIIKYGVAWRMVAGREIRRTDAQAQGVPRDAQEIPPGHILQTARQLKALRDERISEESNTLKHLWGVRK